jgi:protocatechuate 3,4-dioxygenase alpha subunit
VALPVTPSQTVGPFLRIGMEWLTTTDLAGPGAERFAIEGRVLDADGNPVPDAVLELWQPAVPTDQPGADSSARFGRIPTDDAGAFRFVAVKPPRVPAPDGTLQAPHLVVTIFMRGLLKQLTSRIYFPDESANADDMVLNLVPAERRSTLIARRAETGEATLTWNVILQGRDETVFFDI